MSEAEVIVEVGVLVGEELYYEGVRLAALGQGPRSDEGVTERFLELVDVLAVLLGKADAAQLDVVPALVERTPAEVLLDVSVGHDYLSPLS